MCVCLSIVVCFVCVRPVSCVPNVASFSGLSIFIAPLLLSNVYSSHFTSQQLPFVIRMITVPIPDNLLMSSLLSSIRISRVIYVNGCAIPFQEKLRFSYNCLFKYIRNVNKNKTKSKTYQKHLNIGLSSIFNLESTEHNLVANFFFKRRKLCIYKKLCSTYIHVYIKFPKMTTSVYK